ncbi:hypothetical protein [Pontibacillus halophilus]|nr:hypothetical protein [Pontibacillus halophilus]
MKVIGILSVLGVVAYNVIEGEEILTIHEESSSCISLCGSTPEDEAIVSIVVPDQYRDIEESLYNELPEKNVMNRDHNETGVTDRTTAMIEPETLSTATKPTTPATVITGENDKMKTLMSKHLKLQGFTVKLEVSAPSQETPPTTTNGISVTPNEAQLQQLTNDNTKDDYPRYVEAMQQAIHEYDTEKNVWMWKSEPVTEEAQETIVFLAEQHVTHLYLRFDPHVSTEDYETFITLANEQEITVHALMGSPLWGTSERSDDAHKRVNLVATYNSKVSEKAQFVGIHFDVEPYSLDQWDVNKKEAIKEWRQAAESYVPYARERGFVVGSALPFWLDNKEVSQYDPELYKDFIDLNDYVSIMAYRDTALGSNSITSIADGEVAYGGREKVEIGIELKPYKVDYVSFSGKSLTETELETAKVRRYFVEAEAAGLKGITIHDYTEWKNKQ